LNETDFLWSPDGKHIAFIARGEKHIDLYMMNSNGTMQTNITDDAGTEYDFSWSPDGKKIVYSTTGYKDNIANLCVIDIERGQKIQLTSDDIWKRQPVWSPDSMRIVFCAGSKAPSSIYEIHADGTGLIKLAGDNGNNQEPSWCPVLNEKNE
jgi:Tol biopolymer transport system component